MGLTRFDLRTSTEYLRWAFWIFGFLGIDMWHGVWTVCNGPLLRIEHARSIMVEFLQKQYH